MKKIAFLISLGILAVSNLSSQISLNTDGSAADGSAIVDIKATNKGLLVPRIALTGTSDVATISSPATSLMVYNTATASDVTPGYYFWSGSKWERVSSTGSSQIIGVTQTTGNYTALKTDNLILAAGSSNNATITLPAIVTGTDDGLEIVVKNSGSANDLVVVQRNGSSTIDGLTSTSLTRWKAATFVAKGGNWFIKDRQINDAGILEVGPNSSWTTLAEIFGYLALHDPGIPVTIKLEAGTYTVSSTITVNHTNPVTIMGNTYGSTIIDCPSGSTGFLVETECYFKYLSFTTATDPSSIGIDLAGTSEYTEIKDSDFTGFAKGVVISGSHDSWFFDTDFIDCTTAGIELASGTNNSTLKSSEVDFTNCAKGILLTSYGTTTEVSILNSTFYNGGVGQTGIVYVPSGTSPYYSSIIIQNNSFNNIGTFASGFDFTNARDANIFLENNAGVATERPHAKINLVNNASSTTITNSGTWYKAVFTNSTSPSPTKWTVANNKITYQSRNVRDGIAFISGNLKSSSSPATINVAIVKNSTSTTRYGESSIYVPITTSNQSIPFSTNVYLPNIALNDYFEIWVTSTSAGSTVTIDDLNWYTDTH